MQSSRPTEPTPHASHDLLLLAAAADRDVEPAVRAAAADQVAGCPECATLAADLRTIAVGLADLPASRPAPRDMRLSAEQAARLRRGGLLRRLLRPFGEDGLPALRPLAGALTAIGLAGILLTAIPFGFGAGGTAVFNAIGSSVGALAPEAVPAASAGSAEAQGGDFRAATSSPATSAAPAPGTLGSATDNSAKQSGDSIHSQAASALPQLSPLAWASLAFVAFGVGLLVLLFLARRLA
jgi:hypothetical protein